MFSRFPRPSLRRCIHTKGTGTTSAVSQARLNRLGVAVAVGAATSYFAWRLTSDNRRIALDTNPSTCTNLYFFQISLIILTLKPLQPDRHRHSRPYKPRLRPRLTRQTQYQRKHLPQPHRQKMIHRVKKRQK